MAQNNLDLIPVVIDLASATTLELTPATVGWKAHGNRFRLTIGGLNTVTILSGANVLEKFPSTASGLNLVYDYDDRPWYTSNPGEPLIMTTSTSAPVTGVFEYVPVQ